MRCITLLRLFRVEALEHRIVPSDVFRSINGAGNNLIHANWGVAGADLIRISPVAYANGISTPSQPNTLSPREVKIGRAHV